MSTLTRDRLLHMFDYSHVTNELTWKNHRVHRVLGTVAGTKKGNERHVKLRVNGKRTNVSSTRIKTMMVFGCWNLMDVPASIELIKFLFTHDGENLIWKNPYSSRVKGKIVGNNTGSVRFGKRTRHISLLVFFYLNERWPTVREQVDAVRNVSGPSGNLRGVGPHGNKYTATAYDGNKTRHLGLFDSQQEAHEAYLAALEERLLSEL